MTASNCEVMPFNRRSYNCLVCSISFCKGECNYFSSRYFLWGMPQFVIPPSRPSSKPMRWERTQNYFPHSDIEFRGLRKKDHLPHRKIQYRVTGSSKQIYNRNSVTMFWRGWSIITRPRYCYRVPVTTINLLGSSKKPTTSHSTSATRVDK